MQTQQNTEKYVKCGDFLSDARSNAKLMINFFCLITCYKVAIALLKNL